MQTTTTPFFQPMQHKTRGERGTGNVKNNSGFGRNAIDGSFNRSRTNQRLNRVIETALVNHQKAQQLSIA